MPPAFVATRLLLAVIVVVAANLSPAAPASSPSRPTRSSDERSGLKPTLEPDEIPTLGDAGPKDSDRLAPTPALDRSDYTLRPPLVVYDGASFGPENAIPTRLAGLEAPTSNAICLDDEKRPWACGLQARAALFRLIRGRTLECLAVGEAAAEVAATCAIDGQDLSTLLVRQGFARLRGGASSIEQERARQDRAGLWKGGWTIRQP